MKKTFYIALLLSLWACQVANDKTQKYSAEEANQQKSHLIHQLNHALISVISEDLFPPPVASRIYAYSNIAAYETVRLMDTELPSLAGSLNGLDPINFMPESNEAFLEIAMIKSFCEVAKHHVYRDFLLDSVFQQMTDTLRLAYPDQDLFDRSLDLGQQIAQHINQWADNDGYIQTRTMPKYEPLQVNYAWEATQPIYAEALEPHWNKLRPFVMDSASQFRVDMPIDFSEQRNSPFYEAAEEVYQIVNAANEEDIEIAVYWDCNPGPTMIEGHVMKVRKQNTPGGHWIGIHSIVSQKMNRSLTQSCQTYAKLSAGMADGFIAAWDTKYSHHLMRPETYINKHIDPDWLPKLESPPFPEFTSAHSLISAVAASVLAEEYGETSFYDDTNVMFGLPPKSFNNFWEAAEEAAKSRLLGGIHYTFACDIGFEQGKRLGVLVNSKMLVDH